MRTPRKEREEGFTLLLCVFALVLLSFSLVSLSRRSAARAIEAHLGKESAQVRWGLVSSRYTLSRSLPVLLEEDFARWVREREAEGTRWPSVGGAGRAVEGSFRLGELDFAVWFADEQAKLEVNALLGERRLEETRRAVERFTRVPESPRSARLLPHPGHVSEVPGLRTFSQPGQLFEDMGSASPASIPRSALHSITCFTDGRLRLQTAGESVLRERLRGVLERERLDRLLELREEDPSISVSEIVRSLPLNPAERAEVRRRLTDRSECYSLWTEVRAGKRRETCLTLLRPNERPGERELVLRW